MYLLGVLIGGIEVKGFKGQPDLLAPEGHEFVGAEGVGRVVGGVPGGVEETRLLRAAVIQEVAFTVCCRGTWDGIV